MASKQTILVALALLLSCAATSVASDQAIALTDYSGAEVTLPAPAQRILALSPHIVENVFSAGAGEKLVAAVDYSDYPAAAKSIERVGSNNVLNIERIIALQPDLIIAWQSGNTQRSIEQLNQLGFTLYIDEPRTLEDIARSISDIGKLAGTAHIASTAAHTYLTSLNALTKRYADAETVSVFYQVWNKPLQTLNGQHLISQAIDRCGGENIFAEESVIAPVIN
ncbi:MAG: ABC transporter substrate-binding protein, partial [Arenicella sp.]|nr:ABC transporter substrate-binding protein [Arenicella sp.]